jgi:hypothetical protein
MATLTEGFPCFFLSCKASARVKTRKDGARPALFLIFVLLYVLFVLCRSVYCLCENVYCHQVGIQLQLKNISIFFFDCFPFEDRTDRLSRNVGSYLPNYVA